MAHFRARQHKTSDDGAVVTLYTDPWQAWFVGCPDDAGCHPIPVGAFDSATSARRWADARFLGGMWSGARRAIPVPAQRRPSPA